MPDLFEEGRTSSSDAAAEEGAAGEELCAGGRDMDSASVAAEIRASIEVAEAGVVAEASSAARSRKLSARRELVGSLHRRYAAALWRFLRARCGDADDETVADLTAEVFAAAWRSLLDGKFPRKPWPWLVGIARRKSADFLRQRQRRPRERSWEHLPADERPEVERYLAGETKEEPVLSEAGKALMRAALSELPPEMQELLLEHHVRGISLRELARRSGRTEAAVESAAARARTALRKTFIRKQRNEDAP